ncbi:MAG TPA: sodium/glutamate symporter [Porphyromonadaceae bacterium]|nr:sodium/glutamate symporter [Porphyromonadaceae bacterium]
MMTISLNLYETVGIGVLLLLLGKYLKSKIGFFRQYAIPSPVIGGLLFAFISLFLHQADILHFDFDIILQEFFMVLFFTSIGFNVSLKLLKNGGSKLFLFLGLAVVFCFLQNFVAVLLAGAVDVNPLLALMTGSTALTGGLGTSAAVAPMVEEAGIAGAKTVAIASATFGLLMRSVMGAPLGNNLIIKKDLVKTRIEDEEEQDIDAQQTHKRPIDGERVTKAMFLILIAMGVGVFLTDLLNTWMAHLIDNIRFPIYLGPMLAATILRNIFDTKDKHFALNPEIQLLGDISLNVFISIAIMTLQLWDLSELAFSLIILLLAQVILMFVFARYVCFRVMGRNYDAAVVSAGMVGFGMGSTANAMANLDSICDKFGYSRLAFFIVPLVGSIFIDFINVLIINGFIIAL